MSKALVAGALVIGAVVLAKRHALSRDGFDIERFIERMPDNAPPKWAFETSPRSARTPTGSWNSSIVSKRPTREASLSHLAKSEADPERDRR